MLAVTTSTVAQIRNGFDANIVPANDDGSTDLIPLGFTINFFGTSYSGAYVNNNGNLTFDEPLITYTPEPLSSAGLTVIAPFWADVDTRAGNVTRYGTGTVDGHPAFGATWRDVGYYSFGADKLNSFQVILIDRSDIGAGAFDIEYNYEQVQWETGDASGGSGGLGGSSVRVGYSNGSDVNFELEGSAVNGALIDGGPNALISHELNSGIDGRYLFFVRGGLVAGTLQFSEANYSVNENSGSATITVTRIGGSDGAISVDYTFSGGTATAGSDYSAVSGTLTWINGDTSEKTFTVDIIDDNSFEGDETINLTLENATGGATMGSPDTTVLTIVDNETASVPGTLQFSGANYSVNENGGEATITVTRVGGSSGAISVGYSSTGGTATAGSDYTAVSGTLSWNDGDSSEKTFTVPINDDGDFEGNETINLTLENAMGGANIGTPGTTVLTIVDDETAPMPGTLQFSGANYTVNENGGSATIIVTRVGGSIGTVSVGYSTTGGGTATAGIDYTAVSGTLSWSDGDSSEKTFTVPIIDDGNSEGQENLNLILENATGGSIGAQATAVLTIVDNDTTLAKISRFEVKDAGEMLVEWETLSEVDTGGFRIWWREVPLWNFANSGFIPAEGNDFEGSIYTFSVAGEAGKTYEFFLEEIDLNGNGGTAAVHGPFEYTAP
jgi:hypothetical protein